MRLSPLLLIVGLVGLAACGDDGPRIVEADLTSNSDEGFGPFAFSALITSKTAVREVAVRWQITPGGGDVEELLRLESAGQDLWRAELKGGPFPLGTHVDWWIEAKDGRGNKDIAPAGAGGIAGPRFRFTVGPWTQGSEVHAIAPTRGHADGGTPLLIVGEGFRPDTQLRLDGVDLEELEYVSRRLFRAVTPPGRGSTWVPLAGEDGQHHALRLERAFYYFADPDPQTVDPQSGPFEGGNDVDIVGDHFIDGATVTIDGADCPVSAFRRAEPYPRAVITCTVPPYADGPQDVPTAVDVTVVNPDGLAGTLTNGYLYHPPPTPESVAPDTGPTTGGTTVVIHGRNFLGPVNVAFDGAAATECELLDATRIQCVTPAGELGPADVLVINVDGQRGVLPAGFVYHRPPPAPERVSPGFGDDDGGDRVQVEGRFFQPNARVWFGAVPANCVFVTEERLDCVTPAAGAAGLVDVVVLNPDDRSGLAEDAFHYIGPPEITEVRPAEGSVDGGDVIEIHGVYLMDAQVVVFDGQMATIVDSRDDDGDGLIDVVVVVTPPHAQGPVDVRLTRWDGESDTEIAGFEYVIPPPEISQLDPSEGGTWGGTVVVIHGRWFRPGLTVEFGGVRAFNIEYIDEFTLRVVSPPGPEGRADVRVELATGQEGVLPDGWRYVLPSVFPTGGLIAGYTNVVVTGRDFVPGAVVRIGGRALPTVYEAEDRLLAHTTPVGETGAQDVAVVLPDGRRDARPGAFTFRRLVDVHEGEELVRGDCNDLAVGDIDGDDLPDIAAAMGGIQGLSFVIDQLNVVLFNQGGLAFQSVLMDQAVEYNTTNVDFGDVDADGDLDLLEANLNAEGAASQTRLWLNDGTGGFDLSPDNRFPSTGGTYDAAFTDVDLDGDLDIFLADNVERERLYMNDGAGRFTDDSAGVVDDHLANTHDHDMDMADLNGDGLPEALFAVDNTRGGGNIGANRVYLNEGEHRFTPLPIPALEAMSGDMLDIDALDLDGDGDRDIIAVITGRPAQLFINDGRAGFRIAPAGSFPQTFDGTFEIISGDVDGDGDLDVMLGNMSLSQFVPGEPNRLYVNDGTGGLFDATGSWAPTRFNTTAAVFEDFDNDGVAELFVCNFDGQSQLLAQRP